MRTHTYSVAIAHLVTGDWTVAINQTTLKGGVIADQQLVYGPIWLREHQLQRAVHLAVERLQDLVRQDEADHPAH